MRRRAITLPGEELRPCAAVGDRARDVSARARPLADGADHRPSERRLVPQLPAPDPAADGPRLSRRAAPQAASRSGGGLHALLVDLRREYTLERDRDHDARRTGAAARPARQGPSRRRRGRRHRDLRTSKPIARRCSRLPEYVFKDGPWSRARQRDAPRRSEARTSCAPDYDPAIEKTLRGTGRRMARSTSTTWRIGVEELCRRCNGGRLLPAECPRARHDRRLDERAPRSATASHRRHLRRGLPDAGHAHLITAADARAGRAMAGAR